MTPLLTENPPAGSGRPAVPHEGGTSLPPAPTSHADTGPVCTSCAAPMGPGQDWCLQCGAGAPGSVGGGGLRSLATVAAVTAVLVLGAGAAAFAALSNKGHAAPLVTTTVAQVPQAPVAPLPAPIPATPATPPVTGLVKPPKIPLLARTPVPPAATTPAFTPTKTPTKVTIPSKPKGAEGSPGSAGTEVQPEPILLDTNAASTYNPYGYPATNFGDPSLTIDGDSSTGWTAQPVPATAPHLAEGVLIDLHTRQKVSSLKLITTTPGMTVQIFGANGHTAPSTITAHAWAALSRSIVVKKRHARIGLRDKNKSYRFIVLWISRAPAGVGTPEAAGRVSVNEIELLPTTAG